MKSGDLYCKAVALNKLPEFIRELGGNPERLFAQAGLNMAHIKTHFGVSSALHLSGHLLVDMS